MPLTIYGWGSVISREFHAIARERAHCTVAGRKVADALADGVIGKGGRHFFSVGVIFPIPAEQQGFSHRLESRKVNFEHVRDRCEEILSVDDHARICVIGSESGYRGSFDGNYAEHKAALHRYIEERPLLPGQQLVGISPGIIGDAGMTLRRMDTMNLEWRRVRHPKKRFLTAREVAEMAYFLLYIDRGYTSGTVIRMHGGE